MFAAVDWSDRSQKDIALRAAIALTRSLLDDGVSPVVLVDTFGRGALERVAGALDDGRTDIVALSLWAEESVLFERLARREVGYQDRAMAALINEEVRTIRVAGDTLIDTTTLDASEVARAMADAIGPERGHAREGHPDG